MYTYIVDRTQIYLTPEENAALERESIKTGKTRSQLVREAIDEKYGSRRSLEEFMAALDAARRRLEGGAGRGPVCLPEGICAAPSLVRQRRLERIGREPPATDR